ncbi:MAG: cytochrome c [Myxococcota bacterium]
MKTTSGVAGVTAVGMMMMLGTWGCTGATPGPQSEQDGDGTGDSAADTEGTGGSGADADADSDSAGDGPAVPPPTAVGELCTLPSSELMERYFSAEYEMSCAGCHGRWGEGFADKQIPALPGSIADFEAYAAVVRQGRVEREDMYMPAFAGHSISDAALRADWELMQALPATQRPAAATEQAGPEFAPPVSAPDLDATLAAGLDAWRTMGHEGNCQGCHGPGFDLARFRFRDSDILRRCAGQHLDSATCTAIVDRVHAMRATFDTAGFCDPRAPFLQPGHEILEGDDPAARDLALIDELEAHGIGIASEWVMSHEDAVEMIADIASAGFMNIRVGYPMNTWTRDVFNDQADFSSAEWIPAYPRTAPPEQEQEWNELFDRYIEDPSGPNLWAITDALEEHTTNAPLYIDEREHNGCEPVYMWERYRLGCEVSDCSCDDPNCEPVLDESFTPGLVCSPVLTKDDGTIVGVWNGEYDYDDGQWQRRGWTTHGISRFSALKYRSVLLANHMLRNNSYEIPPTIVPGEEALIAEDKEYRKMVGRRGAAAVWDTGQMATAGGIPHGKNAITGIVPAVLEDIPLGGDAKEGSIDYDIRRHIPWMELGAMLGGTTQGIASAVDSLEYYKTQFPKSPRHTDYGDQMPLHQFYRVALLAQLSYAEFSNAEYGPQPHVPGDWSWAPDKLLRRKPNDSAEGYIGADMQGPDDPRIEILDRLQNNFWRIAMLREIEWIEATGQCASNATDTWLDPAFIADLEDWLVAHSPADHAGLLSQTASHLADLVLTCDRDP